MITQKDYKIIEARCTYNDKGNRDIEYVVIEYQGKLYLGQSNKSQHEALNNAVKSIDKDKLLELYQEKEKLSKNPYNNKTGDIRPYYEWAYDLETLEKQIQAIEREL